MRIFQVRIEVFSGGKKMKWIEQNVIESETPPQKGLYKKINSTPPIEKHIIEVNEFDVQAAFMKQTITDRTNEIIKQTREEFKQENGIELEEDRAKFIKWYFQSRKGVMFEFLLNDLAEFYLKMNEVEVIRIIKPDYEPEYKKTKRKTKKV